jgi:BirA family biotin operon repressor/biotin-[acetyl-CoA-carboxylase] ligase
MFHSVYVVDETPSTQSTAREIDAKPGTIVSTLRQSAGRGRMGRAWADTARDGLAVTFVLEPGRPERLAIVTAVATACGVEAVLGGRAVVGIKWPNDVLVDGRKIAGVLIEQDRDRALIGIGINVRQRSWPDELADRAVSLRQLALEIERVDVATALADELAAAWHVDDNELRDAFGARDVLTGTVATFRRGGMVVTGRVLDLDPMQGLAVETDNGRVWLPAATTTVQPPSPAADDTHGSRRPRARDERPTC